MCVYEGVYVRVRGCVCVCEGLRVGAIEWVSKVCLFVCAHIYTHTHTPKYGQTTRSPPEFITLHARTHTFSGYFRARISSLSPFDKVVGGMCWAITASGASVSVDILFQENSTIGQRIKLSENLVKALLQMKCPLPLQSHQIQVRVLTEQSDAGMRNRGISLERGKERGN